MPASWCSMYQWTQLLPFSIWKVEEHLSSSLVQWTMSLNQLPSGKYGVEYLLASSVSLRNSCEFSHVSREALSLNLWIINGEFDVLRDEGEAYAHKLIDAGVPVTAVRYHGTIHDFVMLNPITDTPPVRGAIEQASHILRKILSNSK